MQGSPARPTTTARSTARPSLAGPAAATAAASSSQTSLPLTTPNDRWRWSSVNINGNRFFLLWVYDVSALALPHVRVSMSKSLRGLSPRPCPYLSRCLRFFPSPCVNPSLSDFGFVSLFLISSDAPQLLQPKEKAGKPASFSVAADEKKWNVSAHDRESVERYDVGWIEWAEVKGQAEAKQRPKRCPTEAKHRRFQSTSSSKIIPRCCYCRWYCFDVVVIVVILLIFHYLVGSDQALYKLILL